MAKAFFPCTAITGLKPRCKTFLYPFLYASIEAAINYITLFYTGALARWFHALPFLVALAFNLYL